MGEYINKNTYRKPEISPQKLFLYGLHKLGGEPTALEISTAVGITYSNARRSGGILRSRGFIKKRRDWKIVDTGRNKMPVRITRWSFTDKKIEWRNAIIKEVEEYLKRKGKIV